jgi:hypothetical protein
VAAPAYADPGFRLTEQAAAPGDTVHFSISDIDEDTTYVLSIDTTQVARGSSTTADKISGQFTMPSLGDASRSVAVAAQIRESDDSTTLTRALQYIAPAPRPPASIAPQPAPAPVASAPSEPTHTLPAGKAPAARRPAAKRHAKRPPRHTRERRTSRRQRAATERRARRRTSPVMRKRARRTRARAAPLFDGIPESTGTGGSGSGLSGDGSDFLGLNAIAPPTAALTGPGADAGGGGPTAAVVIPALLGLAALGLAGTALLRKRRPATVDGHAGDERLAAFRRVARSGSDLRRGLARRRRGRG